ncbi:MAG: hypothetical protein AAF846_16585 [Chloroflexota bacterium]
MLLKLRFVCIVAFASFVIVACGSSDIETTSDNATPPADTVAITSAPDSNATAAPPNPDFNPTATNTLLPPDTESPLVVTIASTDQEEAPEKQFDLRIRNESNAPVSNISLRVYFTPDAEREASDYVLDTYWDEIEAVTISGPEQASDDQYYFTIDYGVTLLPPAEEWGYVGGLHLSDWSEDFDESNDWWYNDDLSETRQPATTMPTYVDGVLIFGSEPTGD